MIDAKMYTNFILYAKGHFEVNSKYYDLAIIAADTYLLDINHITMEDLSETLLTLATKLGCLNDERKIANFMSDISPLHYYKWAESNADGFFFYQVHPDYDYFKAVISKCLSIIKLTKVKAFEAGYLVTLVDIGEPDFTLLPKRYD